jgi:uncharacterized protein
MNKILQFILFLSIFLSIYFGLHYYIYYRIIGFFDIKKKLTLFIIIFSLALSFPVTSLMEHFFSNIISRILYTISAVWMGLMFFLLSSFLIYEILKYFVKLNNQTFGIIIIGIAVFLTLISIISWFFLVTKTVEVPFEGIEEEINIVQLTDIHIGTIQNSGYMKKIVEKTNALNPEMVFITGDLVDGAGVFHDSVYEQLNRFNAPTYFITGNHEIYEGLNITKDLVKKTKIKILDNQVETINGIQIIGLSDPGNQRDHISLDKVKFDKNQPTILLRHQPARVDEAAKAGIDLQLSGHTHNGQIIPFNFIVRGFWKYTKGLYKVDDMYLYVSPGTGTWGPPMRLGSLNEITYITLTPKN